MSALAISDPARVLAGHRFPVQCLAYSPDGRMLASSDTDRQLKLWSNGNESISLNIRSGWQKLWGKDRVSGLCFSNEGDRLFVAAGDSIRAFDIMSGALLWRYMARRSFGFLIVSPTSLALAPQNVIAAAFDDATIALLGSDGSKLNTFTHNSAPRRLVFSPSGSLLIGTDTFSLSVWDALTTEEKEEIPLSDRALSLASSKKEPIVATRELRTVTIWDVDKREKIVTLPVGRGLPLLAFSPTDRTLAMGEHGHIRLVDLNGRQVRDLVINGAIAISLAFSPDGNQMAVGCSDSTIRIWDLH